MSWAKEYTISSPISQNLLQVATIITKELLRTFLYKKSPEKIGQFSFKTHGNFGLKGLTVTKCLRTFLYWKGCSAF